MTILAISLAIAAVLGWLVTLGTLLYGLIAKHDRVEEMFSALIIVSIVATGACAGAAALLGYE